MIELSSRLSPPLSLLEKGLLRVVTSALRLSPPLAASAPISYVRLRPWNRTRFTLCLNLRAVGGLINSIRYPRAEWMKAILESMDRRSFEQTCWGREGEWSQSFLLVDADYRRAFEKFLLIRRLLVWREGEEKERSRMSTNQIRIRERKRGALDWFSDSCTAPWASRNEIWNELRKKFSLYLRQSTEPSRLQYRPNRLFTLSLLKTTVTSFSFSIPQYDPLFQT